MNAPALLRVDQLVKRFGGLAATDGVHLSVVAGDILNFDFVPGVGTST